MSPVRIHHLNSIDLHIQNKDHFKSETDGSDGKESACNVRDSGSIPGLGRSPGEGNGNLLQYPCLENPMDREEPGRLRSTESQRVGHD